MKKRAMHQQRSQRTATANDRAGLARAKKNFAAAASGLRAALSGRAPGSWSSDHRAESSHYTGWNYVAVRAISLQYACATVNAYDHNQSKSSGRTSRIGNGATGKSYNIEEDDSVMLDDSHPLMQLMKNPNPAESGSIFRFRVGQQLNLTGTALIWNVPNKFGQVVERYVIPTAVAQPRQPDRTFPEGYYHISPEIARWYNEGAWISARIGLIAGADIDARQIQCVRWPHPTYSDDGQSSLAAGALWTDTSDMIDQRRWSHMKKGVRPSVVIGLEDEDISEDELYSVNERFNQKYAGPENDGAAVFMNHATSVTPFGATPDEMDYTLGGQFYRDAILALHGTPPIAVGLESPSGRDGLYAPLMQWSFLTIQPQLDLFAEEETRWLARTFGEGIVIEFVARSIDDAASPEEQLKNDVAFGAVEVDEVRMIRGREPWGGERGAALAGSHLQKMQLAHAERLAMIQGQQLQQQQQQQQAQRQQVGIPGQREGGSPVAGTGSAVAAAAANGSMANAAESSLNGAQITAAVNVMMEMQSGRIAESAAVELLAAVGIDRQRAQSMIAAQRRIQPPPESAQSQIPQQQGPGEGEEDPGQEKEFPAANPMNGAKNADRFSGNRGYRYLARHSSYP